VLVNALLVPPGQPVTGCAIECLRTLVISEAIILNLAAAKYWWGRTRELIARIDGSDISEWRNRFNVAFKLGQNSCGLTWC